jgi:hypothetical protein
LITKKDFLNLLNLIEQDDNEKIKHTFVKGASAKNSTFTKSILNYVASSNAPISTVSHPSFLSMIKTANPNLSVPCRQTFSSVVIPKGVSPKDNNFI